ncbi:hypothetical protein DFH06DRAFT_1331101 [Mycena polygramma]|nr:hypothetical protein DFH06DRAFT_1331101 [Mycena polygramma]
MSSTQRLLAIVVAAVTVAAAPLVVERATSFTGTANLGFYGVTSCNCPPWNGPFGVAIPSNDVGTKVCCNEQINISYEGQNTTAVFDAIYDDGAGTDNIALSPEAFAKLAGWPGETSLTPVTWSWF